MGIYKNLAAGELAGLDTMEIRYTGGLYPLVRVKTGALQRDDNLHYPAGTAHLTYGLSGIVSLCCEKNVRNTDPDAAELYEGIALVYEKLIEKLDIYAGTLEEKAGTHAGEDAQNCLRSAAILRQITSGEPLSFLAALGLEYILWQIRIGQAGGTCAGRWDMHLDPFYRRDTAAGILTDDMVLSAVREVWDGMNAAGSGDTLTNIMIGGLAPDGTEPDTRLSVLMLRAAEETKGSEPHVSVRIHSRTDPALFREMVSLQAQGRGQGTLYNDDVILPMLRDWGYSPEEACRYTTDGCTEIVFDGLSTIDFNHIDVVGVFELTLFNGQFADFPRKPVPYFHKNHAPHICCPDADAGFASGDPVSMDSFDAFYEAFLRQYLHQVDLRLRRLHDTHRNRFGNAAGSLFLNGTFETVLQRGKGIFSGGLPTDDYMIFSGSIPTAADCLMGIKKMVFTEKRYTIEEVRTALLADFAGYEQMQAEMKAIPKFGCDNDAVDLLAADIAERFCSRIREYSDTTGFRVLPALVGWKFLEESYAVCATPDGRNYGDPIAEHYNATPGNAVLGPTAVIRSVSKAPLHKAAGTAAVHITLPAFRDTGESTDVLTALNRAACDMGLLFLNIGIYDRDALLAAQKEPDQYNDLIVRVWGFSARFIDLSREMQDHVIARVQVQ